MASPRIVLRAPAPISRWWSSKSAGEQRGVAVFALAVFAALAWWVVWQPLTRDILVTRAANARGMVALAGAQRMSEELAGLSRTPAPAGNADPRADLERILAQQNLRVALTQQDWKDGRVRLVFGAVNYDALVAGLETLQRDALLRTVRAELVLAR
jgi:type II secretory pathway component PulM